MVGDHGVDAMSISSKDTSVILENSAYPESINSNDEVEDDEFFVDSSTRSPNMNPPQNIPQNPPQNPPQNMKITFQNFQNPPQNIPQNPPPNPPQKKEEEVEEEDWEFFCRCGIHGHNYDDGKSMVQCSKCNRWSHCECVGYNVHTNLDFICSSCLR